MQLPNYSNSAYLAEVGMSIVKRIVENEMHWIFRRMHQEHDLGIDGFIDVINDSAQATGKSIALQIKAGSHYFSEITATGWVYRGATSHLNYYLNHDIPVLILIVDTDQEKVFWNLCEASQTQKAGDNWKIVIPAVNRFDGSSKHSIERYLKPITDYTSELQIFWEFNKQFEERNIFIEVGKDNIERQNYEPIESSVRRLLVNPTLIEKKVGGVDVWISGYESDIRPLYEIPEVKKWLEILLGYEVGLAFFLVAGSGAVMLRLLVFANVRYTAVATVGPDGNKRYQINLEPVSLSLFYKDLILALELFAGRYHLPVGMVQERKDTLLRFLTVDIFTRPHS